MMPLLFCIVFCVVFAHLIDFKIQPWVTNENNIGRENHSRQYEPYRKIYRKIARKTILPQGAGLSGGSQNEFLNMVIFFTV